MIAPEACVPSTVEQEQSRLEKENDDNGKAYEQEGDNNNGQQPAIAIPVTVEKEPRQDNHDDTSKANMKSPDPTTFATEQHLRHHFCQAHRKPIALSLLVIVIAAVIAIIIIATQSKHIVDPPYIPTTVDYSTGVSLITHYAINTNIRSRLATTKLTMKVANALNCSSIHMITLQLPLNTRVTSLKTMDLSHDGCETNGVVKELQDARDIFLDQTTNGALASAYVEVQDSFTYSVQVSIPPFGITNVELVVEQLLQQRLGEIVFEIPLLPNEEVDKVVFDLAVEDVMGQPVDFRVDLNVPGVYESESVETANSESANSTNSSSSSGSARAPIHLDVPDARQYDLPRVIRGKYTPGDIPENGILYADNTCFEHYFHPATLEAMPRNIIFVLDTSDSMQYDSKLSKAKIALKKFIDTLSPQDTFTIQTFASKGTMDLWGSGPGTQDEKKSAKIFLDALKVEDDWRNWGTNLHEAFLEALLRAKSDIEESQGDTVTILVMISDGYASMGETNRAKIAKHVYDLNKDGGVKMFSLGFQGNADMTLLDAIALMNGGVSAPILQGEEDFASQIMTFLESELGTVLLSDVYVKMTGEQVKVLGETQNTFPLLADGYEVVVRGLLQLPQGKELDTPLKAITTAATLEGIKDWEVPAIMTSDVSDTAAPSLCFQSYAHARITQLLRMHDAANFLGNDIIKSLVTLTDANCKEKDFADCIKAEALNLAIKANVVAKGLTAMVTVDDLKCMKRDESAEVCLDGTTPDSTESGDGGEKYPSYGDEYAIYGDSYYSAAGTGAAHAGSLFFLVLFCISFWLNC